MGEGGAIRVVRFSSRHAGRYTTLLEGLHVSLGISANILKMPVLSFLPSRVHPSSREAAHRSYLFWCSHRGNICRLARLYTALLLLMSDFKRLFVICRVCQLSIEASWTEQGRCRSRGFWPLRRTKRKSCFFFFFLSSSSSFLRRIFKSKMS